MAANASANVSAGWSQQQAHYELFVPLLLALAAAAVVANGCVLLSVPWLRRPVGSDLVLSLSLAAVDAWASALIFVGLAVNSYLPVVHDIKLSKCARLTIEGFRAGGMVSSVLHLATVALNHYCGIVFPLRHKRLVSAAAIRRVLVALWLVPPALHLLFFGAVQGQAFRSHNCSNVHFLNKFSYRLTTSFTFLTPMLLTLALYGAILLRLRRRQRDVAQLSAGERRRVRSNGRLFVTMLLMLGSFLLGWLPIALLYGLWCPRGCPISLRDVQLIFFLMLVFNALVVLKMFLNALIYASRFAELRAAMLRMWRSLWHAERAQSARPNEPRLQCARDRRSPANTAQSRTRLLNAY